MIKSLSGPGLLLILPLLASPILTGCQTSLPESSGAIEQAKADTWVSACEIFRPRIKQEQFDAAPQWVRDYFLAAAAQWKETCAK